MVMATSSQRKNNKYHCYSMQKNPTEYNLTPKQNMKKKKDATESASNWKKET